MAKIGYLFTEEALTGAMKSARALVNHNDAGMVARMDAAGLRALVTAQNRMIWKLIELLADGEEVEIDEEDADVIFGEDGKYDWDGEDEPSEPGEAVDEGGSEDGQD